MGRPSETCYVEKKRNESDGTAARKVTSVGIATEGKREGGLDDAGDVDDDDERRWIGAKLGS